MIVYSYYSAIERMNSTAVSDITKRRMIIFISRIASGKLVP